MDAIEPIDSANDRDSTNAASREQSSLDAASLGDACRTTVVHAVGKSLGVRGYIESVPSEVPDVVRALLSSALAQLAEAGIRRVHLFIPNPITPSQQQRDVRAIAEALEFHECPGETLFMRALDVPPVEVQSERDRYVLRDGTREDLRTIGIQLRHVRELAFESWEFPLIVENMGKPNRFFKIIEQGGCVVGVSIGGSADSRGTISHIWVHPDHRWSTERPETPHLGKWLSDTSLRAMYNAGARTVHVMTVAGNDKAGHFWRSQGFEAQTSLQFLERDL